MQDQPKAVSSSKTMAKSVIKSLLSALALSTLVACGGGSSGGGSPADISGSGMTQGTIDGFGSVIVNGVHYNTDNAEFQVRKVSGQQSDLSVGQWVTIIGSRDGREGVASSVSYDLSIKGPIAAIDLAVGELVVVGQTVVINKLTILDGIALAALNVGDYVEVSGIRNAAGALVAGYIGQASNDGEVELHGAVSQLNTIAMTFRIAAQEVDYRAANMDLDDADIADGMYVEVEGTLDAAGVLVATEVEREELDIDAGTEVDIEGRISALDISNKQFSVQGLVVSYNDSTEFEDGSVSDLVLDKLVEVEGVVNSNGVLDAESIEFEELAGGEIAALVDGVDNAAATVTVLGMAIAVNANTRIDDDRSNTPSFSLADIIVGDYLELLVSSDAAGNLTALKLLRKSNEQEIEVSAALEAFDSIAMTVQLLGESYDLSSNAIAFENDQGAVVNRADFFAALNVADEVELVGRMTGSVFVIEEATIED